MIKKIKWKNHAILGSLELDFTKTDGTPYNTIILAGENGTGKTTILETLSTFLNLDSVEPFEYIEYEAMDEIYRITPLEQNANLGFHQRIKQIDNSVVTVNSTKNYHPERIESDFEDLRHYGVVYSKARSGFNTKPIQSTTIQQLDSNKYEDDSKDDFTSIKQLLVDIDAQDNSEWMRISRENEGIPFEEFKNKSKMNRFENAFNNFFESVRFWGVDNNNENEIKILFEKFGKKISIDNLSTGEKEIVFRGAHLLKNINSISGGLVLIDEPELSLHPKWQQKVLQYYRNLFKNNGTQSVQMIIATHSEYVLRSAFEDSDNVLIIVLRVENGTICSKKITVPIILPTITSAEINYLAYGILSVDYHIALYGYLQNKTGNSTVKSCDDYIALQNGVYDPTKHSKSSLFKNKNGNVTRYQTLPTYIRNLIDHPDPSKSYTQEEFKCSIELLIELCR